MLLPSLLGSPNTLYQNVADLRRKGHGHTGMSEAQSDNWDFRPNYPAPWPIQGISYLKQDGQSYAPTPQAWTNEGPRQLSEPLASSHRARLQRGLAPHAPPGPGNDPPVMTNARQSPRPRTSSPKRSRSVTIHGDNTYDNFRKQKGPYNSWDGGADDMPSELPPKYVANLAEAKKMHRQI